MSKKELTAEEIMQKRIEKRKEEVAQEAKQELKESLSTECYAVTTDPDKGPRDFLLVKLKYDIKTMKAIVEDYVELEEKIIGLRFPIEQENLKYYFDKLKRAQRSK